MWMGLFYSFNFSPRVFLLSFTQGHELGWVLLSPCWTPHFKHTVTIGWINPLPAPLSTGQANGLDNPYHAGNQQRCMLTGSCSVRRKTEKRQVSLTFLMSLSLTAPSVDGCRPHFKETPLNWIHGHLHKQIWGRRMEGYCAWSLICQLIQHIVSPLMLH